jgi:hypothetical protein
MVLTTSFDFALALGVASVIGSRAIATVVVIAWRNVLGPVLLSISFLGAAREGLPNSAAERLLPNAVAHFLRQGPRPGDVGVGDGHDARRLDGRGAGRR